MSKISQALARLFDQHRIVFWYDTQQELREDYESVQLEGIARREHLEQISMSSSASSRDKTAAPKEIDLDDGVKVNYNKFGNALQKIAGLSKE